MIIPPESTLVGLEISVGIDKLRDKDIATPMEIIIMMIPMMILEFMLLGLQRRTYKHEYLCHNN